MSEKMKKLLSVILTIVCLGVFIYASQGLIAAALDYYENRKVMGNIQETFYDVELNENTNDPQIIRPGFDTLLKENEDLVGWITMEGTQIDYPILQAEDNIEYLTRNFYKDENRAGSIFMDYRNDIESTGQNTILYGHRMKDGSMFEQLSKYQDEDFFKNHQTFQFDTLYESYEAEIFAVYATTTDFNYIQTDFANDGEYEQLLARIKEESMYDTDVEVKASDQIITLSTCDYVLDENEGRLVVQAKLVSKG
ncbi:class B sortase [Virgibacillus sp. YIM 98842]|uniref:class B sortase n=1 Tax=Virgibacillus sp. YIM 98842 TaxID=2663533 RepID=UPI0013DBD5E0|nr:class B sortase [Virgibacillus sp. YIM 98842]